MAGFADAWAAVTRSRDGDSVSPDLQPLLRNLYVVLVSEQVDLAALKEGLEALLGFLVERGRTNANCWAADLFFANSEGWERDWTEQELPDDYHDILAMMGEALHDTVKAPDVAANYGCLPEQLLDQVRRLKDAGCDCR